MPMVCIIYLSGLFFSYLVILDAIVLNFALTLEFLENAFYTGALKQFDSKAFEDAGFPSWVRNRFEEIAAHEATHVQVLSDVLGDQATQPCQYSLCVFVFIGYRVLVFSDFLFGDSPYNDVKSFIALSLMLEGVGEAFVLGLRF